MPPEETDVAIRRFKKALIERAPGGELPPHLGYQPGGSKPDDTRWQDGAHRAAPFEPRLIAKHDSTT